MVRNFNGKGGGFAGVAGGQRWGDVYTDDQARLYAKTVSFWLIWAVANVHVHFFDAQSNALGHLEGGGIGTGGGTGGGTGSWK